MKFKERLLDATSRFKMPFNGNQAGSEDVEIVDHIAAANADKTEEEIIRRSEDEFVISGKEYWGAENKGINLLATFGHARFFSGANYIVANMVHQPLRIVGVVALSLAVVLVTSVSMKAVVSSQATSTEIPAFQSWISSGLGVDYSTATTLSENKKAHAKYGAWSYVSEKRTGKADFHKFAEEINELTSDIKPSEGSKSALKIGAADPLYEGFQSQIWNANYQKLYKPSSAAPIEVEETGKVPTISAAGFWTLASNVDHLDKTGVLVKSDQSNERVAAVFYNGQLSVNVITVNDCFNVFGQPLTEECKPTDLTKVETEFPVATLDEMFDRSIKFEATAEKVHEVASNDKDLLWYIRLPEASTVTAGLSSADFNNATKFVKSNFQATDFFSLNTKTWASVGKLAVIPKMVAAKGFFQNPEVVKLMEKTAVVGITDDQNEAVVASFVNGRVAARTITREGNSLVCRTVFGENDEDTCLHGSMEKQEAFIRSLYEKSENAIAPYEMVYYANAPLKGEAAHSSSETYAAIMSAVKSDFLNHGFASKKWQFTKQLGAQIPMRKADGIFNDPTIGDTLSKASAVFLADPNNQDVFALATNINGELQLDVFRHYRGTFRCVNVFGHELDYCEQNELGVADSQFPDFVKTMFNKKKED